ncbi:hypothetical protein [uncultured Microbulbifer sp.]|uniref:DUF6630 family protein n=1 Tax=uncultured Microbulbifer sp. TaxID=348147 RepID=UPI002618739B|nr:hypothetical protein [uncultured Microbulbifer sp.]
MIKVVLIVVLAASIVGFAVKVLARTGKDSEVPTVWDKVIDVSSKISVNPDKAKEYILLGKNDDDIRGEDSVFYNQARNDFGNNFIQWIQEDIEDQMIPCAVFKTVMAGLGYMGHLDWKNIYNIEEFIFSLDKVLSKLSLKKISLEEKQEITTEIQKSKDDQNYIARTNVSKLEEAVEARGYKILWFDEDGDSYAFFIVKPAIFSSLQSVQLDTHHKFRQVQF